jgi:acetyl/propionyl-CoA carboxylase alpha subunit
MKKLLIANRGEIARRILKAGQHRGFDVAVIATTQDRDSLVCQEAKNVITVESFLNKEEIVKAAKAWGAQLIHPGYGFLSENFEFCALVENAGMIFVGPTSKNMQMMGNKESAKKIAKQCAVPILNGFFSYELKKIPVKQWPQEFQKRNIQAPFLIKASFGGGGRGMRIVERPEELPAMVQRASQEAQASFENGTVFVESYLKNPKHIEIQIFGDGCGGGVFLGERECSLQRRHQKIVEEAPSSFVCADLRKKMGQAALAVVAHTQYRGAGTLEFLVDEHKNFYFLEMNTRLQVEHPVTEQAYGVDLVQAQFDLAQGYWPPDFPDPRIFCVLEPKQVSLEVRILAEDARNEFLPTPGKILFYKEPQGSKIRVDTAVCEGARINPQFDSLIAKLIVTASRRGEAVELMSRAIENFNILGCTTNLSFLQSLIRHPDFLLGKHSTGWIGENIHKLQEPLLPQKFMDFLNSAKFKETLFLMFQKEKNLSSINSIFYRQKFSLDKVTNNTSHFHFEIQKSQQKNKFYLLGQVVSTFIKEEEFKNFFFSRCLNFYDFLDPLDPKAKIPFLALPLSFQEIHLSILGEYLTLKSPFFDESEKNKFSRNSGEIRSPMAGKVFEVLVSKEQEVREGQVLFVVESMKMQLEIKSAYRGKIKEIFVKQEQILTGSELLAVFHPDS